jgi:ribosomal protein S18 acetylase RimI-like enzyme
MSKTQFVKASIDHLSLLLHLEVQLFEGTDRFSRRRFKYLVESKNALTLLCFQDRESMGYGIALKNKLRNGKIKGRIYSLGVVKKGRRKGLGSKLLRALERWLIEEGADFITLETRLGRNPAFYENRGYKGTYRLPRYYGRAPGLRMRKK